ncbi:MAG: type II toxin-antitoxin system HicB family antitoxin [Deltaproteobacteria bacterium]|nr:type II toxin-antitoxin system HicB family antitoxin [Deltaproteobacteria bacterium]
MHIEGFVYEERDGTWVAHCPDLDLSSCGSSEEDAYSHMHEAIDLFVRSCIERGTLERALTELGWRCLGPTGRQQKPCNLAASDAPPAFMIDAIKRTHEGRWSSTIRLGH